MHHFAKSTVVLLLELGILIVVSLACTVTVSPPQIVPVTQVVPVPVTQVVPVPVTQIVPVPVTQIVPTTKVVLEVAAGKPTIASGFWRYSESHQYPPANIVDRRTDEPEGCGSGPTTYWLLPDHQTGWVQVDLLQNYNIVKLRWLNTHNGRCGHDRATTRFRIALSLTGAFIGEEQTVYRGTMAFSFSPVYEEIVLSRPVAARFVRFYVDDYYRVGGGLNELEVYAEIIGP